MRKVANLSIAPQNVPWDTTKNPTFGWDGANTGALPSAFTTCEVTGLDWINFRYISGSQSPGTGNFSNDSSGLLPWLTFAQAVSGNRASQYIKDEIRHGAQGVLGCFVDVNGRLITLPFSIGTGYPIEVPKGFTGQIFLQVGIDDVVTYADNVGTNYVMEVWQYDIFINVGCTQERFVLPDQPIEKDSF